MCKHAEQWCHLWTARQSEHHKERFRYQCSQHKLLLPIPLNHWLCMHDFDYTSSEISCSKIPDQFSFRTKYLDKLVTHLLKTQSQCCGLLLSLIGPLYVRVPLTFFSIKCLMYTFIERHLNFNIVHIKKSVWKNIRINQFYSWTFLHTHDVCMNI